MNPQLIVPNMHVVLIHYPLGVFFLGMLIELGAILFWRRHPVRAAGRWMILIGGLSMLPVAASGLFALQDVVARSSTVADGTWAEVAGGSSLTQQQWTELSQHTLIMAVASALVSVVVVTFLALSDRMRDKLYVPLLLLLLMSMGIMTRAAWISGEAIYRHGVSVDAAGPAASVQAGESTHSSASSTQPVGLKAKALAWSDKVDVLFPPEQSHAIMAGFGFAVALAALGLSIRQITAVVPEVVPSDPAQALLRSLEPPTIPQPLYPGRTWAVAAIVFLITAAGGVYVIAKDADTLSAKALWALVTDKSAAGGGPISRRLAHVIAGSSLIVLPMVMGLLARFAPRQKTVLAVLALLLLLAIAAQVWIGVLLLFDGPVGTVIRFAASK